MSPFQDESPFHVPSSSHCSVSVRPLGVHFPMSDRSDSLSDVATTASAWSDSLGSFSMVDASPGDPISQLERHIQYVAGSLEHLGAVEETSFQTLQDAQLHDMCFLKNEMFLKNGCSGVWLC